MRWRRLARPTARAAIDALLHPRAIAIVGATERMQYGGRLVANLLKGGYTGTIVPINPNRATVQGLPCYPTVSDAPCLIDLVAIVIPAAAVPAALAECDELEVRTALVISAGFAEVEDGVSLAPAWTRICGPNCLGVGNVANGMWASANVLAPIDDRLRTGGIAVISQSGATAFGPLIAIARERGIGLRYIVSSGNEVDLTTADYVEYMVADRAVTAIACVLEGIRDGPALRRAIERAQAADKPLIVLKLGRTDAGAAAALSHTAAMTGRTDTFDALCRQYGVARADDWDQLLELASALGSARRPRGRSVGIVSHSGGIGALVADHCQTLALDVPPLGPRASEAIGAILEGRGAARNPADVTGHYDRETFRPILDAVLNDPGVDLLAVATAGSPAVVERIQAATDASTKPTVVCWTGGLDETDGLAALRDSGLPIVHQPRDAAVALSSLAAWSEARRRLAEPVVRSRDPAAWATITDLAARAPGEALSEWTGLELMRRGGVAAVRSVALVNSDGLESVRAAALRYPLVAKIDSPDLAHKSDVGGVELGIRDEPSLRVALARIGERVAAAAPRARRRGFLIQETASPGLEVILGFQRDEFLGPVVMLALGGTHVEAIGEPAWRLLPARPSDLEAMLGEVRGLERLLAGHRGAPALDRDALVDALTAFAGWCGDLAGSLETAEINPLIVLPTGNGAVAVDCLIVPRSDRP